VLDSSQAARIGGDMRWTPQGRSKNLEDRRGSGFRGGAAGMGIGGTVLLVVLSLIFGRDLTGIGGGAPGTVVESQGDVAVQETPEEAQLADFVSFVLDTAQAHWARALPQATGREYRDAKLVLFRNVVQSGCGTAQSAMGPFYCPLDEKVYIDLGFYDDLRQRFGAPGDFAQAYVLAHEIGHHVQHVLGIDQQVRQAQQGNPRQANPLSVRLELQADCFAGVWGHAAAQGAQPILQAGDVEEGLNAAAAIGDDRLQRQSGGGVNPEGFTHGTSAQRATWFRRGLESGDPNACDTFSDIR
jgi:predicted metalloprotease